MVKVTVMVGLVSQQKNQRGQVGGCKTQNEVNHERSITEESFENAFHSPQVAFAALTLPPHKREQLWRTTMLGQMTRRVTGEQGKKRRLKR